jgi:hypothetical protein
MIPSGLKALFFNGPLAVNPLVAVSRRWIALLFVVGAEPPPHGV